MPRLVLLFSGKRKSGKDHVTSLLHSRLSDSVLIRLAAPIKHAYAKTHDLDYDKLMGSDQYKELYREQMVAWGEEVRNKDSSFFCREAISMFEAEKFQIWIITDCRRESDIDFFKSNYKCVTVRVKADDASRGRRGFVFTQGIDDRPTECGLDAFASFDFVLDNSIDDQVHTVLEPLVDYVKKSVSEKPND